MAEDTAGMAGTEQAGCTAVGCTVGVGCMAVDLEGLEG